MSDKSTENQRTEQRKNRGNPQNLKPFKKGQSGNPKGRPKKGSAIADILNSIGEEKVTLGGMNITKKRAVMMKVYAEAIKGQSWAVHFIADRTEGKAVERVITNSTQELTEKLSELSIEELKAIIYGD